MESIGCRFTWLNKSILQGHTMCNSLPKVTWSPFFFNHVKNTLLWFLFCLTGMRDLLRPGSTVSVVICSRCVLRYWQELSVLVVLLIIILIFCTDKASDLISPAPIAARWQDWFLNSGMYEILAAMFTEYFAHYISYIIIQSIKWTC